LAFSSSIFGFFVQNNPDTNAIDMLQFDSGAEDIVQSVLSDKIVILNECDVPGASSNGKNPSQLLLLLLVVKYRTQYEYNL